MSEFDDPELAKRLRQAGGHNADVNVAYQRVLNRVRRARRRRVAVLGTVASALLLAVGAVVLTRPVANPGGPSDRATFEVSLPVETGTTLTGGSTSVPGEGPTAITTRTTDAGHSATTTGTGANHDGTDDVNDNGTDEGHDDATETSHVPSSATEIFSGAGGSVTVRLQDGSLTLVTWAANSGYVVTVKHSGGDRVEVRFESSRHRTNIRIDLEDGGMAPAIEEDDN